MFELEDLFDGFAKANEESNASSGDSEKLSGTDALKFLMNNPM